MNSSIAAIITAAGSSSRIGVKKEYRLVGDKTDMEGRPLTVLGKAALAFAACSRISTVVITVPNDPNLGEFAARDSLPARLLKHRGKPHFFFVPGGPTRRASVHHALSLLEGYHPGYVLIHDGARPWIEPALIDRVIDAMLKHRAAIPLLPLTDTPKEIDEAGFVKRHLRRMLVGNAQTPQGFSFPEILRAHKRAAEREQGENKVYTDDAEVWGEFVGDVFVVPGSPLNKKITFPEDLEMLVRGETNEPANRPRS
ncbi:MAG: 2-C-methyl-D-erythritol 4-phosphate cytidylyltransferase [Spirochaetaceae bacterium]|jgi:2-C-methyl-D-erythritol 4-phosphate cytidylyltransferase/2-C-methyl-D-erythritol 4-phosphate cytidylyltransferase/2-C-methyl-D-erythritol 2,4-cyclodiphosphate synthase|nr:2-C-methyl-D-erythritol 4-phosphate cytidylyltransferase [Spirochaetaceae bacterium]